MRSPSALSCVWLACLTQCGIPGPAAPTPQAERRAAESLQAAAVAHGPGAFDPSRSFRRVSQIQVFAEEQLQFTARLHYSCAPPRERLELQREDGSTHLQVFDGETGREWVAGEVTRFDIRDEVELRSKYRSIVPAFLRPGPPRAYWVESRELDGRVYDVVERHLTATESWRLWIDTETHLVHRILCSTAVGRETQLREDWLFDYQEIDGMRLPQRQITLVNGKKVSEARVVEYQTDCTFPAEHFSVKTFPRQN